MSKEAIWRQLDLGFEMVKQSPPKGQDIITDIYIHKPAAVKPWFTGIPVKARWYVEELIDDAGTSVERAAKSYRTRKGAYRAMVRNGKPGHKYQIRRVTSLAV